MKTQNLKRIPGFYEVDNDTEGRAHLTTKPLGNKDLAESNQ